MSRFLAALRVNEWERHFGDDQAQSASISDLPLGGGLGGAGAVQLAPEGLILMSSATLVVQPVSLLTLDQQSPFARVNGGEDFHLFPPSLEGWTPGEGDVLASKEYEGAPCRENPFDEDTTIEVRRQ